MKEKIMAVLKTLNLVGSRSLPFGVIATHVRGELIVPVTEADILAALRKCQENGWIARTVDTEVDGTEMWYLLDAGRIAMRSRQ